MTEETTIKEFEIREFSVPYLTEKIEKLNKRMSKHGIPPLTFEVSEVIKTIYENNRLNKQVSEIPESLKFETGWNAINFVNVTLDVALIKIADWELIAVLERMNDLIVPNLVPNKTITELPTEIYCDHCGYSRTRKEGFLIQNTVSGKIMQIGRQCLRDYLGHNPASMLWYSKMIHSISEIEEECFSGEGMKLDNLEALLPILAYTSATIRKHGWISGTMAWNNENLTSTANMVSFWMHTYPFMKDSDKAKETDPIIPTEKDFEDAQACVDHFSGMDAKEFLEAGNDYKFKCILFSQEGLITKKNFGLAVSMISAFYKDQEWKIKNSVKMEDLEKSKNAPFVGEIKERLKNLTLKVVSRKFFHNDFGGTTLFTFVDPETFSTFTWFCSTDLDLNLEEIVTLTGTVKDHKEFRGIKQTVITRCKIQEN